MVTAADLTQDHFEGLFDPSSSESQNDRRGELFCAIVPFVQAELQRQLVVQTVAADLSADPALTSLLVTSSAALPAPDDPTKILFDAFMQAGSRGLTAAYYASADGSGNPLQPPQTIPTADPKDNTDTTQKPTGANSALLSGYLEVPAAGPYRFYAHLGPNVTAELRLEGLPGPILQGTGTTAQPEVSGVVDLTPGGLYHLTCTVSGLNGGDIQLLVQGQHLPKGDLKQLRLYPETALTATNQARILLGKALQVISSFGLSREETRRLIAHGADFALLDAGSLPTTPPAPGRALFTPFLNLAAYASLKATLAPKSDDLLALFIGSRHSYPAALGAAGAQAQILQDCAAQFAALARRDPSDALVAAAQLGFTASAQVVGSQTQAVAPDYSQPQRLARLWKLFQVIAPLGQTVKTIAGWATPAIDVPLAASLKSAVKAQYDADTWLAVAQPIFDGLRRLQRDAMVTYINFKEGFDEPGQLFGRLLIDPGMETVVQTSRVRLAISTVLLFVQRCLLNLEPMVAPAAIQTDQWQALSHYELWTAHRKIFLYPENVLEPEFRDDKSSLYLDLESALLKGDASDDIVEDAFLKYLQKLEELARLEIMAVYAEQTRRPLPIPSTM